MYKETLRLIKKATQPATVPQTQQTQKQQSGPPPNVAKTPVPAPKVEQQAAANTGTTNAVAQTSPAVNKPGLLDQFNAYADQNPFVRPLVYGGTSALLGSAFGGGKGALIGAILGGAAGFGHDYLRNPQLYSNLFGSTTMGTMPTANGTQPAAPDGRSPWSYGLPLAGMSAVAAGASYGPRLVNWLFSLFGRKGRGNSTALTLRGGRGGAPRNPNGSTVRVMNTARQLRANNGGVAPVRRPSQIDSRRMIRDQVPVVNAQVVLQPWQQAQWQKSHSLPTTQTALTIRR